jgi:RNA polymerase sigma factor (sigma-70 family)
MKMEATVDQQIDKDLIDRATKGDPSAGPFLVSLYGERLLGYARAHAPDLTDADRESIVEQAIEAGVRAIGSFDPERGSLFSWFRTQVRYRTLSFRRQSVPRVEFTGQEPTPPQEEFNLPLPEIEAIRSAIARLSAEDQVILALRDTERLEYSELSQRLDIKEAAARQRHSRAIQRLRRELESESALEKYLEPKEEVDR